MIFLALTAGEITGIIGACATVFTVLIVPTSKAIKKYIKKKKDEKDKQEARNKKLDLVYEKVVTMDENQANLNNQFNNFLIDYDEFTTQNLKYMINDAFFGYENVHEIPSDVLTNACECCEIYVNKKHKNHEIRPRCELLWREQERRATEREVTHE